MSTTQLPPPLQGPLHPLNTMPSLGEAVNVTSVPEGTTVVQEPLRQVTPTDLLSTVPRPLISMVKGKKSGKNFLYTSWEGTLSFPCSSYAVIAKK